jgi:hypothetical protein
MDLLNPRDELLVGLIAGTAAARDHDDIGSGTSPKPRSAVNDKAPVSERFGPGSAATKTTSAPGRRLSTS